MLEWDSLPIARNTSCMAGASPMISVWRIGSSALVISIARYSSGRGPVSQARAARVDDLRSQLAARPEHRGPAEARLAPHGHDPIRGQGALFLQQP